MLSSRQCLQLLLGWALLLGQPAGGTQEEAEAVEVAETEAEGAEPVLPTSAADPVTSGEPSEELDEDLWRIDPWTATDKQLEKLASMERQRLEDPNSYWAASWTRSCIQALSGHRDAPFYKLLEDADLNIEKAIGTMFSFSLYVGRTNCTQEEGKKAADFSHYYGYWGRRHHLFLPPKPKCDLDPSPWIKKCMFYVYEDARTGTSSIFHHECQNQIYGETTWLAPEE